MTIELTLNGNNYSIAIDRNNYVPIKHKINTKADSPNFGKEITEELSYCTTLDRAIKRILREEVSSSEARVSLTEYAANMRAMTEELTEQLNLIEA